MKGRRSKRLDIEIDKLTNSIENAISGEVAETLIVRLHGRDARSIKRREWRFDWRREIAEEHREVHKLVTATDPSVIQGLVSLEAKTDHVFLHLIENARFNVGSDKLYVGIAGNLFAFACKRSLEMGYDGFVSFVPKTVLREHYARTIGAEMLAGNKMVMVIDREAAHGLIERYYKAKDQWGS